MKIAVFGSGYVGVVTAACLAECGHQVTGIDIDADKVERLNSGDPVIYEPGLRDLLERNLNRRLEFVVDASQAVQEAEVIFICVGTPQRMNGEADLTYVRSAAQTIGRHMRSYTVIVNKSTVPVGTYDVVRRTIVEAQGPNRSAFDIVSNPEFLREGSAVHDFFNPDRIVIGASSERAKELMLRLYQPVAQATHPILFTSIPTAELIKYASNAMLATRISFMNELSQLCEAVGADVTQVADGMGFDTRIGPHFLNAGCGYGGSCFPKDVKALGQLFEQHGLVSGILSAVDRANERQKRLVVQKLKKYLSSLEDKTIAVWGLAFKPHTDDIREATSLVVIQELQRAYANVRVYDPQAQENAEKHLPGAEKIYFAQDAYDALEGADALVVLTEWDEFRNPDFARMQTLMERPVVIDGRNLFVPSEARAAGFEYDSIGR